MPLSRANKRLLYVPLTLRPAHEINIQLVGAILRLHVLSYEEAVELLLPRSQSSSSTTTTRCSSPMQMPETLTRFNIRRLLHNPSLASSANVVGWVAGLPAYGYRHERKPWLALCIHKERGSCGRIEVAFQACATLRSLQCKDEVHSYQPVDRRTL